MLRTGILRPKGKPNASVQRTRNAMPIFPLCHKYFLLEYTLTMFPLCRKYFTLNFKS
jgi:hypothetical protein